MSENMPAFPQPPMVGAAGLTTFPFDGYGRGGISERDYFAAAAMTGLLSGYTDCHPLSTSLAKRRRDDASDDDLQNEAAEGHARDAYRLADAMLKERNRNG